MKTFLLISIIVNILSFSNCNNILMKGEQDSSSETPILSLMLGYKLSKLTLSGTAAKGSIQNGLVEVYKLNSTGACDTNLLGSTFTDVNGSYKVTFPRTGGSVCVYVKPDPKGTTLMYDEKTSRSIGVPPSSGFKLTNILEESKINPLKLNSAPVSPLTSAIAGRVKALSDLTSTPNTKKILEKAGKEIVIRFGLNRSFVTSSRSLSKDTSSINDTDYPTLQDLDIDLNAAGNDVSVNYLMVLAGFSQLAYSNKSNPNLSSEDIQNAITVFSNDFVDGKFNGKDKNGSSLSFTGSGIALSSNPLSENLLPAIKTFIQEGGKIGLSPNNQISIASSELEKIQFIDNREIVSPVSEGLPLAPSPTFGIPGNGLTYHLFNVNTPVNLSPISSSGTITTCSISPSLPEGLQISSNCTISGTPTQVLPQTTYTITAENFIGTNTGSLSLKVNPELKLTYSSSTFNQNESSSVTPTIVVTGTIISCTGSLPAGMTIHPTTCVISGTPIAAQATVNHTVLVTDSNGSTSSASAPISVTDKTAPTIANPSITVTPSNGTSVTLSWNAATDNFSSLQYAVYYILDETTSTPSFDTVAQMEGYAGVTTTGYSSATTATITGLTAGKSAYYFNVIAKDSAGNKSPYAKSLVNTGIFLMDCANGTGKGNFGGYNGALTLCDQSGKAKKCNGVRPFISLSGMNLIDAPTYNNFGSSLPVYSVAISNSAVTKFSDNWQSLFSVSLPNPFTNNGIMGLTADLYTFTLSDGTFDATNNCSGGTSTSGSGRGANSADGSAINWFSGTVYTCNPTINKTLISVCF